VRRIPIRLKLAAALSVPLLALAVVTALGVRSATTDRADVRGQTDLADAALGPEGVISALQNERSWAAVDLIGQNAVNVPVEGYEETRAQTDRALRSLDESLSTKSDAVADAFEPVLASIPQLEGLRAEIDANVAAVNPRTIENNLGFGNAVFTRFTALIEPLFDATTRVATAIDDPELRQGTELADTSARQIEVLSLLLNRIITDKTLTPGGIDTSSEVSVASELHQQFKHNAEIMRAGTGPYAEIADTAFPVALTDRVNEQVDRAIIANQVVVQDLLAAVDVPDEEGYEAFKQAIAEQIRDRSAELNAAADLRQRLLLGLSGLVVVLAVALAWLVSRSITRPLRALTHQAKEMADRRLPEAVADILETPLGQDVAVPQVPPVTLLTRDEVSDVADALNTVQDTAVDLAVEQAVLRRNIADSFVNLGRRNQNLLGRQLDFITQLESQETEPETLASLFRLDHLATRMRRNAESLLVLAGIEPPRQWAAPVRVTDVIRAALSEVEDYQRVTVRGVEPATIVGSGAADLAHLLAELIENALVFSPPDQTVDIRGRNRPGASGGPDGSIGYTLAVIDSGLGMSAEDIAAADRRLAGTESFTIAPSKYLGHYVAGNLAARHGIRVHLESSPGNGITAAVDLPSVLLATDADLAASDGPVPVRSVWPPPAPDTREVPALGRKIDGDLLGRLDCISRSRNRSALPEPGADRPPPVGPAPAAPAPTAPASAAPPPALPRRARGEPRTTARGLTRRVRGAQLPTTEPLRLDRGTDDAPRAPGAPAPAATQPAPESAPQPAPARRGRRRDAARDPDRPGRTAEQPRSADAVYDFLANFTAGVQRGMDDHGGPRHPRVGGRRP
jgi:signal transduction histidine kinase